MEERDPGVVLWFTFKSKTVHSPNGDHKKKMNGDTVLQEPMTLCSEARKNGESRSSASSPSAQHHHHGHHHTN